MRILFIQRHFWPDVPTYAHLTRGIAVQLAADGHDVSVFSAVPSYNSAYSGEPPPLNQRIDGIAIRRVQVPTNNGKRLRQQLWDAGLFLSRVSAHLLRYRGAYDAIVVTNAPPIFLAALVRITGRITGTPYVYHLQDLQPEAAVISRGIPRGPLERCLLRIDRLNVEQAAAVVVLSHDMQRTLTERGVSGHNIHTINNFIIEPAARESDDLGRVQDRSEPFRVIFAGNMGQFQGLDRVIDAARLLVERRDIQFVFMGSGTQVEALRRQAGPLLRQNVTFVPHHSVEDAMAVLAGAQLGLVPLRPGMYRVAYPSKVMAYTEAGCRILLLMECDSQAAKTAQQFGIGSCCQAADPRVIADAILAERDHFQERGQERGHIQAVARSLFGKKSILPAWTALFESLQGNRAYGQIGDRSETHGDPATTLRAATQHDLDQVVAVHTASFPGFTMTGLGPRFLRKYYEMVLGYSGHIFLVAEGQDSGIVGFAAGFMNPGRFYAEFRKKRWAFGLAAFPNLVRNPLLVRDMRGGSQWASDQQGLELPDLCELASIGVEPSAAGGGIGSRLVRLFATQSFAAGAASVTLTTDVADNERVRAFYSRLGFEESGGLRRGIDRQMVRYRLYPHSRDA